jgi:hypothetical protein
MVYRRCPGSGPAEQQKKVNFAGNPAVRRRLELEVSFNLLTQFQTWEPSQEEERRRE